MPSDSNGVYTLPDGYLAVTGETILASQHNPPLEDLGASMTQRVMRTGAAPMTGPLKLADGTAPAPGLAFASAITTGVYKTTDGIGFAIGGTQVAELVAGGFRSGVRTLGQLIFGVWSAAPALCVLPFGQTLSRTTYADLWTTAQAEIALGNTFFNNGNGTTTFGIGDLRGRVAVGGDKMGGSAAGRLTATYFGAVTGATGQVIGDVGGLEGQTLTTAQLAVHSHANTLNESPHSHGYGTPPGQNIQTGGTNLGLVSGTNSATFQSNGTLTGITITNVSAGSGAAHNNVQASMVVNFALFAGV